MNLTGNDPTCPDMPQTMHSQVARIDVQADAAMTSHTASYQYESQGDVPDDATTLDIY